MNTRVRRKPLGERSEPHPNARAVYQHTEHFLAGTCNDEALEAYRLAMGRAIELGQAMDLFVYHLSNLYLARFGLPGEPPPHLESEPLRRAAAALGGPPDGRGESGATNARRREA